MWDDNGSSGQSGDSSKQRSSIAASIAKWLIPSATALFVIVGYIVQTAHEDLLGIGSISHSTNSYIESAAQFCRDLISLPLDVILGRPWMLSGHWATMVFCCLGIGILIASRFLVRFPGRALAASFVALGLLLVKFIAFDMPLTLVHDIILGDAGLWHLVDPKDHVEFPSTLPGPIYGIAVEQANRFAYSIVCSHLGKGLLSNHIELMGGADTLGNHDCDPPGNQQTDQERAASPKTTFTVIVILQLIIVIASIIAIRSPIRSLPNAIIGLLGLIYCLTIPYDYGKLVKSTSFEFGTVRLATGLIGVDGIDVEPNQAKDGVFRIDGLILSSGDSETRLLHTRVGAKCRLPSTKTQNTIKMLKLAPSEVISIGEIERRDIFEWNYASRPKC